MPNKKDIIALINGLEQSVKKSNDDPKTVINVTVHLWSEFVRTNNDVFTALFELRKELKRIAYKNQNVPLRVTFTNKTTSKLYTFSLNMVEEIVEICVETSEPVDNKEVFDLRVKNEDNGYTLNITWFGDYCQTVSVKLTKTDTIVDAPNLNESKTTDARIISMLKHSSDTYTITKIYAKDIIEKLGEKISWYTQA